MTPELINWLANGERGISSETIFTVLTGVDALGVHHKCHPLDPADFRRCRLLLERCSTLQEKLGEMTAVSPEWRLLVENWQSICDSMDDETPNWRNGQGMATKTYKLMKSIINDARKSVHQ